MERTALPLPCLTAAALGAALLLAVPGVGAAPPPADAGTSAPLPNLPALRGHHPPVTLNFVNADIEAVSRAIGAMLDRQVLVDPRVKGTMTVYSDKPQPLADAYRSYLAALRGLGFTVVQSEGFLKVVPEADAKLQTGVVSVGRTAARGDQVQTQIFRLNYENPNNLIAVLRPLITANNTINSSPGNNSLVITDYADNLERLGKIIAALDQPSSGDIEVVPLKNALATDMVAVAQKLLEGGAGGVPGVAMQNNAVTVLADPRTNSLIVRTPNPARMASARQIIQQLDQPTSGGGPSGNIWVVYLKNADATKLAQVLRAAFGGAAAGGGGTGASGSASHGSQFGGAGSTTPTSSPMGGTAGGGAGTSAQSTTPVAASAEPSTGGQIQADPATNSLIITAPESQYLQMRRVIDQLDVRRAQVYVESMMVDLDARKAAQIGIQWQGLFAAGHNFIGGGTNFGGGTSNIVNLSVGAGGLTGSASSSTATSALGSAGSLVPNGLNLGFVPKINGVYTLAALGNFLEQNTGANVLATPNLVALDNEEAKIVIGQTIPVTTGQYVNSGTNSGTVNPFQTTQRQDVGITLRIKCQVGENGTVRMAVYEENSAVDPQFATNQITSKTSVETYITVDDGAMVVLGGLTRDEYGNEVDGVPLLSRIPVLGNLFKSSSRTRHKHTLMLFLRPVVLHDQSDSDRLTVDRYNAIRSLQEVTQPDPSTVMHVNDAPLVPTIRPDTRIDTTAPAPSGDTLRLPSPPPVPDLRPAAPASAPGAAH